MPSLIRMERKYILFICILLLFIWTTSIREEGFAEQKRFILLLRGEAFRKGGQNSRTIGLEDAYEEQMAACETHMELIRAVEAQGYTVEVYIDTYSTQYDKELRAAYGSYVKDARFHATRFGTQSLLIKDAANMLAGNMLADNRPDALLILRLDMYLKPPFMELYRPDVQTIQFFSICARGWNKTPNGNPRINDILFHFPKRSLDRLSMLYSKNVPMWHELLDYVPLEYGSDYSLMTTKYYDSDSAKDFNPYYRLVGREENPVTRSEGKEFPRDQQ